MLNERKILNLSTCFVCCLAAMACRSKETSPRAISSTQVMPAATASSSPSVNSASASAPHSVSKPKIQPHQSALESANDVHAVDDSASSPLAERGRIVCGKKSCRAGKEICCRSEVPDKIESTCVPVTEAQLRDFGPLDELCDRRGALLVACDESASCGKGRACCETVWGSGQNMPIVCAEPREGERHPCEYGEPCVQGVACATAGARCVKGWCLIPSKRPSLRCGESVCSGDAVCCARSGDTKLECATQCEPPDMGFRCTRPTDCPPGDFCGIMPGGGGCMHSNDGSTWFLCESTADCPPSVKKQCDGLEQSLVCAPSQEADSPILVGKKTCQCQQ
jgi:hypothetical protein